MKAGGDVVRNFGWLLQLEWVSGSAGTRLLFVVGRVPDVAAVLRSLIDVRGQWFETVLNATCFEAIPVAAGAPGAELDLSPFVEVCCGGSWFNLASNQARKWARKGWGIKFDETLHMVDEETVPELRVKLEALSTALSALEAGWAGASVGPGELLDSGWDDEPLRYGVHDRENDEYMTPREFFFL